MTINYSNEYEQEDLKELFSFNYKNLAEQVVNAVLDQEKCPYEVSVEIIYTSNEAIRQINREQRNIDRETDVLSFPMVDFPTPCAYEQLETSEADFYFDPDTGELLLGDIVLSIPRIVEQAKEYGHSRKREYAFLIAHSMLHLLGYDHMTEEEAAQMEAKQNQVLDTLKITRDMEE